MLDPDPTLLTRLVESAASIIAGVLLDDETQLSPQSQEALEGLLVGLNDVSSTTQTRGRDG